LLPGELTIEFQGETPLAEVRHGRYDLDDFCAVG